MKYCGIAHSARLAIARAAFSLCCYVLASEVIAQIMRCDIAVLRDSPWYEEVKQEGIELREQRGIQLVARNLLDTGMDPVQVAAVTGLSMEHIRQLQN